MTQEKSLRLPIEPFRTWLLGRVARSGFAEVAERCEIDERILRRIVQVNGRWVSLDLVDRCLLNSPVGLDDLYPLERED